MRVLRWVFSLCLILGVSSWRSAAQERDTSHSRDYQNCLYGRYGCDLSQLSANEQSAVARSDHDRNYQNCLYGRFGCDPAQLIADEQKAVESSAHDRNYQNCLYGRFGCDSSKLTADERQSAASSPSALESSTSTGSGSTPGGTSGSTDPACAENGSCYGDISERTGRPKTVQVQGYYRKDGTYVRGHYRSAPRRH